MNTMTREINIFFLVIFLKKILCNWKIVLKIEILDMKNTVFERKISLDGINSSINCRIKD